MDNRWGFPHLGTGLALVSRHYQHVLDHPPNIDFFEVIFDNFMQTEGYPLYVLDRLKERWPLILHGVGLNIGSVDPVDFTYLGYLKKLIARTGVRYVSDHLCWTGMRRHYTHDTLPLPMTEEALAHVVSRIRTVQDYLEVPLVLENSSSYVEYAAAAMPEWEFLSRMAEEADCGLLLDVGSVYVSSQNQGFDPTHYLDAIPVERIVYHHMAGHADYGPFRKTTLSDRVTPEVWRLYQHIQSRTGGRTSLIEWDTSVPEFAVLQSEVDLLRMYGQQPEPLAEVSPERRQYSPIPMPLSEAQARLQAFIVSPQPPDLGGMLVQRGRMSPMQQGNVYRIQYWTRLVFELGLYFPCVQRCLGREAFAAVAKDYLGSHPPDHFNIFRMRDRFPRFLQAGTLAADLAWMEKTLRDVGDAPSRSLDVLPEVTPDVRVEFNPVVRLLALGHDVEPWLSGQGDPQQGPCRTFYIVYRTGFTVRRLPVPWELYRLLRLLSRGVPFGVATLRAGGNDEVLRGLLQTLHTYRLIGNISFTTRSVGPPTMSPIQG